MISAIRATFRLSRYRCRFPAHFSRSRAQRLATLVGPGASPAAVFPPGLRRHDSALPRCLADPAARDPSGSRVLAVHAPVDVRQRRLSPTARNPLPTRPTDGSASKDDGRQGGPRSAGGGSTSEEGATTNDAVLVAVGGVLHQDLLSRGEPVDPIAVTVPVSGRRPARGPAVGNLVSPMLVNVPARGNISERLERVEAVVRGAHKSAATGPPPIAILGGVFESWRGSGDTASS